MEREIIEVIRYFEKFGYPPTEAEIYTFISSKTSSVLLKRRLDILVTKKKLVRSHSTGKYPRYTLENRESFFQQQKKREKISQKKLKKVDLYLKLLKLIPQIKLVGLSGTLAMMNTEEEDDIDLFIITAKKRLFTGRFICLMLAQMLGVRRKFSPSVIPAKAGIYRKWIPDQVRNDIYNNKVCLNLFFDERDLRVPDYKARSYVAHEVLQMKPIINKSQTYEKFLYENRWAADFFPNTAWISSKFKVQSSKMQFKIKNYSKNLKFLTLIFNLMTDGIERQLKKLQLYFIKKHQTTEIITDSQLWFHPDDMGEKIKAGPGFWR